MRLAERNAACGANPALRRTRGERRILLLLLGPLRRMREDALNQRRLLDAGDYRQPPAAAATALDLANTCLSRCAQFISSAGIRSAR